MGELELDFKKSAQENAAAYYQRAKELRKKAEGALKAIKDTEKEMRKKSVEKKPLERKVRVKREKKWYERFHWFRSGEFFVIAGRDSKQNEILVSRYLEENDLFFHADIRGAPATILKNGKGAPEGALRETAQFAASYSSAWKQGMNTVDVYAVEKGQVSKEASGEYLGKGSFVISGKRNWFRNTELSLVLFAKGEVPLCVPELSGKIAGTAFLLRPGRIEKGDAAKRIAGELGVSVDEVLSALPAGEFSLKKLAGEKVNK